MTPTKTCSKCGYSWVTCEYVDNGINEKHISFSEFVKYYADNGIEYIHHGDTNSYANYYVKALYKPDTTGATGANCEMIVTINMPYWKGIRLPIIKVNGYKDADKITKDLYNQCKDMSLFMVVY